MLREILFTLLTAVSCTNVRGDSGLTSGTPVLWRYSVQAGLCENKVELDQLVTSVTLAGFGPVHTHVRPAKGEVVQVGRFSRKIDAFLFRKQFQEAGFRDGFIVKADGSSSASEFANQSPPNSVFKITDASFAETALPPFENGDCPVGPGGYWNANIVRLRKSSFRPNLGDPESAALGAMLDRRDREALALYTQLAAGEKKVSPVLRWKSMWYVARLHHSLAERPAAYRAYREILLVLPSEPDRVRAKVEIAGLLMELARSELGTLEECREACREVETEFPSPQSPEIHALTGTAAQMFAETFYWENDFTEAMAQLEKVEQKYSDVPRVYSMALIWKGMSLRQIGRPKEAFEQMQKAFDEFSKAKAQAGGMVETFPGMDPLKMSARWMANIARSDLRDEETYKKWSGWLLEYSN